MKLSQIKLCLSTAEAVNFQLPDGTFVPENFHVTEVGIVDKHFIDCGGTVRRERVANFQLWNADDTGHRLKPAKLQHIITLSEQVLGMEDYEIEVEYQSATIGKYGLDFDGKNFLLLAKNTACLASYACGISTGKQKMKLSDLQGQAGSCCKPGEKCG